MLAGRDIMVQSRTGSGKTGAFILPILAKIDPTRAECQALILTPTRELAQQVSREAEMLGASSGIRIVPVYGGTGYGPQIEGFRAGPHIVVGTPGRILDHLMRGSLSVDRLRVLVFDEADRMLSMGFYPDMRQLRTYLPDKRTGFMFSATYPAMVRSLAGEFLRSPGFLSLSHDRVHISDMEHIWYEVPAMDKDRCLVRIIELENPASAIIFCNTKDKVNYVATVLQRFGYDADQLTADLAQKSRERVLERVRRKSLRFLVATDLAARGIDIANLSHVFIYDFPEDPESYIHRAGRTARAGAGGTAITLVSLTETGSLERVARQYNIEMQRRAVPTDEDVAAVVSERVTALLEAKLRSRDRLQVERMRRFATLARNLGENDDEMSVIAMLIDDYYQATLHSSVEQPEPAPARTATEHRPERDHSAGGTSSKRRRSRRRPRG